jgi:hypothetical protein
MEAKMKSKKKIILRAATPWWARFKEEHLPGLMESWRQHAVGGDKMGRQEADGDHSETFLAKKEGARQ